MSNTDVQEVRERVQILISEIRQIFEQYKIEVPKKRRPWPKSIQERILELWHLGMSSHQIALETGLPAQTLYSWRQRLKNAEPRFLQLKPGKKRHRRSNFDRQRRKMEAAGFNIRSTAAKVAGVLTLLRVLCLKNLSLKN